MPSARSSGRLDHIVVRHGDGSRLAPAASVD
jgi:hypothetical protein